VELYAQICPVPKIGINGFFRHATLIGEYLIFQFNGIINGRDGQSLGRWAW